MHNRTFAVGGLKRYLAEFRLNIHFLPRGGFPYCIGIIFHFHIFEKKTSPSILSDQYIQIGEILRNIKKYYSLEV